METITLVILGLACFLGSPTYSAPIDGEEEPYVLNHEVDTGSEVREEDVVVDSRDQKIVVFNWNKQGYDVSGNMEAVLDYEKDVGVIVMPRRRQCLVVRNLAEVLPKDQALEAAREHGGAAHGVQFERTGVLSDEEKENLPEENRDLCAQWPVYALEPRERGGQPRDRRSGNRVKRGTNWCILALCF